MPLYTFVLDYDGGTYVAQVSAETPERAPVAWAQSLRPGEVRGMGQASLSRLVAELEADTPIPLDGLANTWCSVAGVRGKLALIHFIATLAPAAMANQSLEPTRVGKPPLAAQLKR